MPRLTPEQRTALNDAGFYELAGYLEGIPRDVTMVAIPDTQLEHVLKSLADALLAKRAAEAKVGPDAVQRQQIDGFFRLVDMLACEEGGDVFDRLEKLKAKRDSLLRFAGAELEKDYADLYLACKCGLWERIEKDGGGWIERLTPLGRRAVDAASGKGGAT